jgi:hypothetical protein
MPFRSCAIIALTAPGGGDQPEIWGLRPGLATEEWRHPLEPERPTPPPSALTTRSARPAGRAVGIARAEEMSGEAPEPLEPGVWV